MSTGVMLRELLIAIFACAVLSFGMHADAGAQAAQGEEPTRQQLEIQIEILKDQITRSDEIIKDLKARMERQDIDPVLEAYKKAQIEQYAMQNEALRAHNKYYVAILERNIRAFQSQRFAHGTILFLVAIVVLAGTAFSGFQLWKSSVSGVLATSDLEVSASKIRVTSSVVGLIVLIVSLVFLYIYTSYIYQVSVVEPGKTEAPLKAPN